MLRTLVENNIDIKCHASRLIYPENRNIAHTFTFR